MSDVSNAAGAMPATPVSTNTASSNQPQTAKAVPQQVKPAPNTAQADSKQQPTEAQKNEIRKLKIKIDGKEETLSEEEVIRLAQLSKAAQKRMQEGTESKKQAESFIKQLRENPIELLKNPALGFNKEQLKKIIEDYYAEEFVKPELLTPEQRKLQEYEKQLKQFREKEEADKRAREQQQHADLEKHYAQEYEKMIQEGLQLENLPPSPYTVKRMAFYMSEAVKAGYELTPGQLAKLVKQDYLKEFNTLLGKTDGDVLLSLMGDEIANKLRKADLQRLTGNRPNLPKAPQPIPRAAQNDRGITKARPLNAFLDEAKAKLNNR